MPQLSRPAKSRRGSRGQRRLEACATTSRTPIRGTSSLPISPSICCRLSTKKRRRSSNTTKKRAMPKNAGARKSVSKAFSMAELRPSISSYLRELERRGASKHTVRNYGADLEQFARFFEVPDANSAPSIEQLDLALLREWLSDLYDRGLTPVTIRRKLAAVRALFKF